MIPQKSPGPPPAFSSDEQLVIARAYLVGGKTARELSKVWTTPQRTLSLPLVRKYARTHYDQILSEVAAATAVPDGAQPPLDL